jgi:hypothetical protein
MRDVSSRGVVVISGKFFQLKGRMIADHSRVSVGGFGFRVRRLGGCGKANDRHFECGASLVEVVREGAESIGVLDLLGETLFETGDALKRGRLALVDGAHGAVSSRKSFDSVTALTTRPYLRKWIVQSGTPNAFSARPALRWGDPDLEQMRLLFQNTSLLESTSRAIESGALITVAPA